MSTETECPICYSTIQRTKGFSFPCGHSVCVGCNASMRRSGHNRCPTCRTSRQGFNDTNSQFVLDPDPGGVSFQDAVFPGIQGGGRGSGSTVIFFRSEADSVDLLGANNDAVSDNVSAMLHAVAAGPVASAMTMLLDPQSWQSRFLPPAPNRRFGGAPLATIARRGSGRGRGGKGRPATSGSQRLGRSGRR